ncbi:hypothetical protein E2C01_079113 [Portunus trituberculatus]|uniref:Uncharacterized protein n=1 Tax=Portunus trituberculatus TaxID=210409 RepID=A0A5B7IPE9_PORTR|nr:hypothetical protein [Portunus trituberculatus]
MVLYHPSIPHSLFTHSSTSLPRHPFSPFPLLTLLLIHLRWDILKHTQHSNKLLGECRGGFCGGVVRLRPHPSSWQS